MKKLLVAASTAGIVCALSAGSANAAEPSQRVGDDPLAAANVKATQVERTLTKKLGTSYGGTWIANNASVVVGTTDRAELKEIRSTGVRAELVKFSAAALTQATDKLDGAKAPDGITQWGPVTKANRVVVHTLPGRVSAGKKFVQRAGVDPASVRFDVTTQKPRTFYDVVGGDAYYIGGATRCSVGFSVEGGFVSAGHCGDPGDPTSGYNQVAQGQFEASIFPGNDMSWVSVNENWTPTPTVAGASGPVSVEGSQEAAVGAEVCRSGSTTGWHCGTIQAKDQTVRYPQGTVNGLTQTTVCAEPGDSGGSYISNGQAQGVTSGGSGNCTSGGTTFFQPVNPILEKYGLTLVTAN